MKNTYLLLLLFTVFPIAAQKRTTEEFVSGKLNEKREITIQLPASYEVGKNKYPLVILLDGDYLFDPFSGILSYTSYWDDLPEVILVGVRQDKNNERETDCETGPESGLPEEKADKFFEFIEQELVPHMEKEYRTAPFKVIAGHDLTAGFLNFFLYKNKPLFNAYISFGPELPTDMETRLPEKLGQLQEPVSYYLAAADGDLASIRTKIKTLDENIKALKNPMLKYRFDEFKDATHYSLVVFGIPNALYHIFSEYQPISSAEYQDKLVKLPSGYAKYLEDKYDRTEKDLGVKIPIRLNDFKAVEAAIMKNGAYDELKDLAQLAKKDYPKTLLGEYYTALFYEKTGETKKAIKTYLNSYTYSEIGDLTKDFMLEKAEQLKSNVKE